MKTREDNPDDWFMLANERLRGTDALFKSEGVTLLGIEALHEAVERFLKGFLVARGHKLQRTHNLSALLDQAILHNTAFKRFADLADGLTDQFWAQHYPGGDLTGVGTDYPLLRSQAEELIALIETETHSSQNEIPSPPCAPPHQNSSPA